MLAVHESGRVDPEFYGEETGLGVAYVEDEHVTGVICFDLLNLVVGVYACEAVPVID